MNIFLKTAVLFLLMLVFKFSAFCQYDSLSARISLDELGVVDFDTIVEGDTIRHTFWFTNSGGSDLKIKQAWPSCGCTMPTYTDEVIKPGSRGKIDVEFHSAGLTGQVEKYIIVINNGPEVQPRFKVVILTAKQQKELNFVRVSDRNKKKLRSKVIKKSIKK